MWHSACKQYDVCSESRSEFFNQVFFCFFNVTLTFRTFTMNASKSLIALAVIAASFGASAADQDSAKLELRGSVAVNCTIAVKPTAKATSLDILGGEKSTLVGVVTESCNSGNGYTVQVSSDNAGQLLSTSAGAKPTLYTAAYDDALGDIAKELVAGRDTAFFNRQGNLTVSFAGDAQAIAGVYSDIVNVVIKAK
jgi:hypothetical protein